MVPIQECINATAYVAGHTDEELVAKGDALALGLLMARRAGREVCEHASDLLIFLAAETERRAETRDMTVERLPVNSHEMG